MVNFDPVPWATGPGVENSESVVRAGAYTYMQGAEGVTQVDDLKVVPFAVPGTGVNVNPGAGSAVNRHPGYGGELYTFRNPVAGPVDIAATGSGSGRVEMIAVRVEDPFLQGSPYTNDGVYVKAIVVSNVPANATRLQEVPGHEGDTGIALARINIPASTGTITGAMITDLRKVAIPRQHTQRLFYSIVTGDTETLTATGANGEVWPNASTNAWGNLNIPEWATVADIEVQWNSVFVPPGSAWGPMWLQIGGVGANPPLRTQSSRWDSPNSGGNTRMVFALADRRSIPAELRGTSQRVYPYARNDGSTPSAYPTMNTSSSIKVTVTFYEQAV
ncbi:hypothetical protein [Paramicrobacterium chengjingii]|uniref:Phage tail protein n=1 Tax=Paramicrobacterium chengjingii TaxID=2769067 RepID=A0ABX6YLW9_9MICO|nr:hypothetical protein [Microbacterium chengjingii]QPZ39695.1 hypothetical protein HCR76_06525 [Microbacterium chengjingii]